MRELRGRLIASLTFGFLVVIGMALGSQDYRMIYGWKARQRIRRLDGKRSLGGAWMAWFAPMAPKSRSAGESLSVISPRRGEERDFRLGLECNL